MSDNTWLREAYREFDDPDLMLIGKRLLKSRFDIYDPDFMEPYYFVAPGMLKAFIQICKKVKGMGGIGLFLEAIEQMDRYAKKNGQSIVVREFPGRYQEWLNEREKSSAIGNVTKYLGID